MAQAGLTSKIYDMRPGGMQIVALSYTVVMASGSHGDT